jgi:hypothetical protein
MFSINRLQLCYQWLERIRCADGADVQNCHRVRKTGFVTLGPLGSAR